MPYYPYASPSVFVNGVPPALIAKTKSNQSQERDATLSRSYILALCLSTDGRVGA
jgi:hypothetical protein